jgi:hypothetical protein
VVPATPVIVGPLDQALGARRRRALDITHFGEPSRPNDVVGVTERMAHQASLVIASLNERREFVECHPPASFVVNW